MAYLSLPLRYTQPQSLAAVAAVFGHDAPLADRARVLELGCASGGNLIPLAARFPKAHFTGIDIDAPGITAARRQIEALGLTNAEVEVADIARFELGAREFDYIICHGVFSWTPAPVRTAIFRICANALSDNGLAAVSFNVLPGWRVQQVIRDLCLQASGGDTSAVGITKARASIAEIAAAGSPDRPYALAVQQAGQRLLKRPDSYISGEFLAPVNEPFDFLTFTTAAASAGLHYVCDGELTASTPEFLQPHAAAAIRAAGHDPLTIQARLDAFSGRTFRRAVLSKRNSTAEPMADALKRLHFSSDLRASDDGFVGLEGRPFRPNSASLTGALTALAQAFPSTLSFREIEAAAAPADTQFTEQLLHSAGQGRVQISSLPFVAGRAFAPRAFPVARLQARAGQRWVASRLHRAAVPGAEAMKILVELDIDATPPASMDPAMWRRGLRELEREALLDP